MMVVQAGAAARVLHGELPDARNALEVIAVTGRETVDGMRTLLGVLRAEDGPDALKATRRLVPQLAATRVVMLTTFDLDDCIVDAFRAGASGFLLASLTCCGCSPAA